MKIQMLRQNSTNIIPKTRKKEIRNFTKQYLKEQNGYASSKSSLYNGVAIVMRGLGGALITGAVIAELPELIENSITLMVVQAATGIGSLAVALSRLESDKISTGSAKIKAKPFIGKMAEKGFNSKEELIYGTRQYMKKAGGFFTSIIPNIFSAKPASNLIKQTEQK